MIEHIKDWWPAVVAMASAVITPLAWLFRLESKVTANARDVRALYKLRAEDAEAASRQRSEDLAASREARQNTNDRLSRIEDVLAEVGRDIKTMMQRRPE